MRLVIEDNRLVIVGDGGTTRFQGDIPEHLHDEVQALIDWAEGERTADEQRTDELIDALVEADPIGALPHVQTWESAIGTFVKTGRYLQYEGQIYRIQAPGHRVATEHPPSVNTAALYELVNAPDTPDAYIPWVTGQSYAEGAKVTHKGIRYTSMTPNNHWEPGAPGIYDNIWRNDGAVEG